MDVPEDAWWGGVVAQQTIVQTSLRTLPYPNFTDIGVKLGRPLNTSLGWRQS